MAAIHVTMLYVLLIRKLYGYFKIMESGLNCLIRIMLFICVVWCVVGELLCLNEHRIIMSVCMTQHVTCTVTPRDAEKGKATM